MTGAVFPLALLAPEFGWIGIVLVAAAVVSELRGDAERAVRRNFRADAPFRLIFWLRLALYSIALVLGLSLLLQSQTLVSVGLVMTILVFIVLEFLIRSYGIRKGRGAPPSDSDVRRSPEDRR